MTNIRRFDHKGKKCFTIMGVDYGGPLEILQESTEHILAKIPGSRCWSGVGCSPVYYGPQFAIFRKGVLPHTFSDYQPVWEKRYDRKTRKVMLKEALKIYEGLKK